MNQIIVNKQIIVRIKSEYFVYAMLFYFIQPQQTESCTAVKLAHHGGGGLHTYHWEIIMPKLLFYLTWPQLLTLIMVHGSVIGWKLQDYL